MHWISLIASLMIIGICQAQSGSSLKQPETGNSNTGNSFHGPGASGFQKGADGSVHTNSGNVPQGSLAKNEKDGQNKITWANSGNYNQCYIILPFFIAALTAIIHY